MCYMVMCVMMGVGDVDDGYDSDGCVVCVDGDVDLVCVCCVWLFVCCGFLRCWMEIVLWN